MDTDDRVALRPHAGHGFEPALGEGPFQGIRPLDVAGGLRSRVKKALCQIAAEAGQ